MYDNDDDDDGFYVNIEYNGPHTGQGRGGRYGIGMCGCCIDYRYHKNTIPCY